MSELSRILIVDDNFQNLYVMEEMLSGLEVEIVQASSGAEALKKISGREFALALVDVQMPGMNGFETVEKIRQDEKNKFLNVIYVTAEQNELSYRKKGIETGAVDFMTKPLVPDLFIGKVNIFLNLFLQKKNLENEIEKREKIETELIRARDMAENAAQAKQQFLSTMSHEIRTPLNAIINTVNFLMYEDPRPDQLDNLETLKFSSESLLHLINDILDYSKIDSGKVEIENTLFDIHHLLTGIRQSFEQEAKKKGLDLLVTIDDRIPRLLGGDPVRLSQILFNLMGNALKFTEKGHVRVSVEEAGIEKEACRIRFSIEDTGIGIPADRQKSIFEPFTQANSSITRVYGGTGLGLAITRKLISLQGGTLSLSSETDRGSNFSFTLSFLLGEKTTPENPKQNMPAFEDLSGVYILIVEDNPVNQKIVSKLLDRWGASSDIAANGLEAVEKVTQKHYDLILMDIHMPEMNGYDATLKIREMEGNNVNDLPILALTASAFLEDQNRIYHYGMNGFVIKPFSPPELNRKIADSLRNLSAGSGNPKKDPNENFFMKNII